MRYNFSFNIIFQALEGTYIDKKCPFTGNISIRGRILTGVVQKMKMQRTIVIRRDYLHYIRKYNRFEKRHRNMSVHLSPCFRLVPIYLLIILKKLLKTCDDIDDGLLNYNLKQLIRLLKKKWMLYLSYIKTFHIYIYIVIVYYRDVEIGDVVTIGECRPLSKTVRFNVLKVSKGTGSKKSFKKF